MAKEIIVKRGVKKKLIDTMKVNRLTVDRALFGMTENSLADKIRKEAIKLGGVESPK